MAATTDYVIIGTTAFICALVFAITSSLTVFQMVDEVNDKLPEERKFSHLWWYWSKYERLFAEYRRLYPDVGLLRRFRVLTALLFVCFLVSAWGLGFFPFR